MTVSVPAPTAPETSSLPILFAGRITSGTIGYPFTCPMESAVTVIPFTGPSPLTCRVSRSSPFSMEPIMTPAERSLPSAAVITGLVLCAALAASTVSLVVHAKALIWASAAVALTK